MRDTEEDEIQILIDKTIEEARDAFDKSGDNMGTAMDEKRARLFEFRAIQKALITRF